MSGIYSFTLENLAMKDLHWPSAAGCREATGWRSGECSSFGQFAAGASSAGVLAGSCSSECSSACPSACFLPAGPYLFAKRQRHIHYYKCGSDLHPWLE